jgi:tetratricopeptide (TPR) repeat protein
MKRRPIGTAAMLAFLLATVVLGPLRISAQQPTPTPVAPVPTPMPDIERRIYQLEVAQAQTVESLRLGNDANRSLITLFSILIGVLVAVQGFVSYSQWRREGERESRQALREKEQDPVDRAGVEQVTKIMNVVQQTLESRLAAEREAREEATRAHEKLDKVLDQVRALDSFYRNFQTTIKNARQAIEETALALARTSRHDFRGKTDKLNLFVRQFSTFKTEFASLEEQPRPFSPRVPYICGIAALYNNQPEVAKQYLTVVISSQQREADEVDIAYNRRVANAYYYLGLTESNFGNNQDAIDYFENANKRDLQSRDFLTRIVTAEAYLMINNFDKAKQFLAEVEEGLREIERIEGRLRNFQLHLRSRAALIRANMAILKREDNWCEEVRRLLEPVYVAEPQYYYATATLAQVNASLSDTDSARKLFREAYETIERSGDLHIVTEARSNILLLMVAGMCCKHGLKDKNRVGEHLDRADDLRGSLPEIGHQVCTVFSTLSKRNENRETISHHIELIRKGDVLLESGR